MSVDIFPFELVIKDDENKELFINTVENVLSENLQCRNSFGCSILNCHTHVGSKKHLSLFIEAELLFHNSYYNKGFAFCTVELLKKRVRSFKKIMLVGYETFGEMYICETAELLRNKLNKEVEYCIAETVGKNERIRTLSDNSFFDDEIYYAFIVPINTTLTTHDKLISRFRKWFSKNNININVNLKNSINIGLIIIAPSEKNDFWNIVSKSERKIELLKEKTLELSSLEKRPVYYFANVEADWYNSKDCIGCFPDLNKEGNLLDERVIFEVNRASVVPMLQLGTEIVPEPLNTGDKIREDKNLLKLIILNKYLIHHHIKRNGNHYQYYFETQKFFKEIKGIRSTEKDLSLESWLEGVKENVKQKTPLDKIVYNFIVAPRHYSNAGFVQCVNDIVFDGAARILYFDVSKEYRRNIKAKYSDLTRLVENIINCRQPSKLCFYYVDDMIFSGTNYLRTKNLLNTLIPTAANTDLCSRSLFEAVILLVGRNSNDSKSWFIEERENFYEYVHLSISPMRNHEDACTLCKLVDDFETIKKLCATNRMSEAMQTIIDDHSEVDIIDYLSGNIKDVEIKQTTDEKRSRVLVRHLLNERLNNHWWITGNESVVNKESETDIYNVINEFYEKLFAELQQAKYRVFEEIKEYDLISLRIALIKVISRPFFSYHIRQKQAALHFCLQLLDKILPGLEKEDVDIDEDNLKIIKSLINALADLNAVYLIRSNTIQRIMNLVNNGQIKFEAINFYKAVKKIVSLSSDENKCLLLENVLVTGSEKNFFHSDEMDNKLKGLNEEEWLALYLENNGILVEGFNNVIANNVEFGPNAPYYLDKFCEFFLINNSVNRQSEIVKEYKRLRWLLEDGNPDGTCLENIAEGIKRIFGENITVQTFLYDKSAALTFDGFYLLNDEAHGEKFYVKDYLQRLKRTLDTESVVLDTIYRKDGICIIKITGNKGQSIYISLSDMSVHEIRKWFLVKILLTLRNYFVELLDRLNVPNEMNKRSVEQKKAALGIKKAHAHHSLEYFEGSDIFSYNQQLLEMKKNGKDFENIYCRSKRLYDNYLLLLANEFVSDLYRQVIYYPNEIYYEGGVIGYRLKYFAEKAGFEDDGEGNMIYEICVPKEKGEQIVRITCDVKSFEQKKFWFFKKSETLIPSYLNLILAFASNAGYHFEEKPDTVCNFYVGAEGNDIVFRNPISNLALDEERKQKIHNAAVTKMNTPPWEYPDDDQSITLWSFSRYFQISEMEFSKMLDEDTVSGNKTRNAGRKCPEKSKLGKGIDVQVNDREFIVKLSMLEECKRRGGF